MQIDRDWIDGAMRENDMSMRDVARRMGVDIATLSRLLSGKREMRVSEVGSLADALGVRQEDLLAHMGLPISRERSLHVGHRLLGTGAVEADDGHEMNITLPDIPDGAWAVRAETLGSPLTVFDGWIFIVAPAQSGARPLGRLALIEPREGPAFLGVPVRVEQDGRHMIRDLTSAVHYCDVRSERPVLKILP